MLNIKKNTFITFSIDILVDYFNDNTVYKIIFLTYTIALFFSSTSVDSRTKECFCCFGKYSLDGLRCRWISCSKHSLEKDDIYRYFPIIFYLMGFHKFMIFLKKYMKLKIKILLTGKRFLISKKDFTYINTLKIFKTVIYLICASMYLPFMVNLSNKTN